MKVFTDEQVAQTVAELGIPDLAAATIGQVVLLAQKLEATTGKQFIRMDQGVPGFDPCTIGLKAEQAALETGMAAIYPPADGVKELKEAASRFVKAFVDIDVAPSGCIPTVGGVQGSFGTMLAVSQAVAGRDKILFIDPGFPIQKSQLKLFGGRYEQFDLYEHRGEKLRAKLEQYLATGEIAGILYSNPNNPAWTCLDEGELKIIGQLATQYNAIVIEDLAYFCMDARRDLAHPFVAPFQATAARYTENYVVLLSGSKIFSYAGQRIGVAVISDRLYAQKFPALAARYGTSGAFGPTLTASIFYMITSGVTHTTQYGLAAMLSAASDGAYNFIEATSGYAQRAQRMKQLFAQAGFHVVYDRDANEAVGDGFFFTIGRKGWSSAQLMLELIKYGVTSITLTTTGSEQQGIRACTSRMSEELFPVLEERLNAFDADNR